MSTKLPKEVYALAKSMGLDLKDLEPEAQDIWRMLNDMQSNDPLQYESFIRSTIDENKDLLNNKENGNFTSMNSNGSQSADDPSAQPMIRPTASFAIISRTCGGDGIKIRESSNDGKVLYINVCSHIGIQRPVDDFGKVMEGDVLHNTNSAEIPMIIGQPRDDKISLTTKADGIINECIVIDVLVNPSVTNTTKLNQPFRRDLVELIFKSIESETIVRINSSFSWEISKRSYECGRGEERLVPALFPVKNPTEKPPKQNDTMQDPKNLFDSVLKERTKFESDINISIDKNIMAVNGREVDGCKESTLKPVNNARINEGDSEKDVLSSNNADEIRKNLEFKKGFLSNKPSKSIPDHSSAEARQKLPSSKDNYEIDALFKSIDGEWSQEVRSGNDTMQEDSSDIEKILKGLAGTLSAPVLGQSNAKIELQKVPDDSNINIANNLKDIDIVVKDTQDSNEMKVTLSGISPEQFTKLDLLISKNEIILSSGKGSSQPAAKISCRGKRFVKSSVKASSSKKNKTVNISVKYE